MSFLVKRRNTYHLHVKVPMDLVKNLNSIRIIPLHPAIADQFAEYVGTVRAAGHQRLFPELKKANGKYSHQFSKAFMAYLRNKVGITDPKKNFHSFRHTATDCLWKAQVQESIIEELTGRAGKTETSQGLPGGHPVPGGCAKVGI